MNLLKISIVIACISMAACKKDKAPTTTPDTTDTTQAQTYDDYSALKVGNYWVYQMYQTYQSNDSSIAFNSFDSSYIEKDTLINGITYYKHTTVSQNPFYLSSSYLRDSLHYIVSSNGGILFSSEDFTTVFNDQPFGPNGATGDTLNVKRQMVDKDQVITVPAGTFTASALNTIYYYPPGSPKSDIHYRYWYAKNVGKVKYTTGVYFSQPDIRQERWLVRYHVQ